MSRNLIRVWVAKYEAGAFDDEFQAADLLKQYEAKIAALARLAGRQALEIEFLVREGFTGPEDINDSKETAPSKRLQSVIPRYNKVLHGPMLAAEIGLKKIREECRRFDTWVRRLEALEIQ